MNKPLIKPTAKDFQITKDRRRLLPSVDLVLRSASKLVEFWGRSRVSAQVKLELAAIRKNVSTKEIGPIADEAALEPVGAAPSVQEQTSTLRQTINLTGIVLHSNLGRAVLPENAITAVSTVAGGPVNLEYDLSTGQRGNREEALEGLICKLTGAEAATVVNNNAAAILLTMNTLAQSKEVPLSRGEMVEIGDSFRIADIMERSGCTLIEVGATNRTHLRDFEQAINNRTGLIIKIHPSNYSISGFSKNVSESQLSGLAKRHQIPFVVDVGSGNLLDFSRYGLPREPTVMMSLESGADIITFSGDKLLGGPQCGIIAGRADLIDQMRKNPIKRALRIDKMTLAALLEVLKLYRYPEKLLSDLPTLKYLNRSQNDIRLQAQRVAPILAEVLPSHYRVETDECASQIGSGAMPIESLPSFGIKITADSDELLRRLAEVMRSLRCPVIGRIKDGKFQLDLRCLDRESLFLEQLSELKGSLR